MSLRKSLYGLAAAAALMAGAQAQAETAPAPVYAVAKPAKAAKIAKAPTRAAPAAQAHAPVLQVQAAPAARPAPTERDIAVLFDLWNAALQTGSPELVASLYAPDGVLLPTVSNRVRTTRAEIVDYFQHFLALQPRGTINQSFIRVMGPDLALHSGIYTFDVVREGKPEQVTARFDYLYRRVNGRWLIANHHSSKMPEPVAPGSIQTAAAH
jgi:uncharacterized protein (TIGR02246 family)